MIAKIETVEQIPAAVYKRKLNHSVTAVWSYLTENSKLQQWFSELEIKSLERGGEIYFYVGDGEL